MARNFNEKHADTDKAFRAVVDAEQKKRDANTAKLRAERLAQPKPAPKAKGPKA